MKTSSQRVFTLLLIPMFMASCGQGSSQPSEPNHYSNGKARKEFFHLKKSAESINYSENEMYVEVEGTKFVGLESAFNEKRTCLYGFSLAGIDGPGTFQVKTQFVCFNTDRFQLKLQREWCESGSAGCEIDPGGISIGIGNLVVREAVEMNLTQPETRDAYPTLLDLDVNARFTYSSP